MGMWVGGGSGRKYGRGRRGVPRYGAMADINMTPFIDVMLVLLIIFMVAAPLLTTGVSVDLPQTSASALNIDKKPIAVSLNEQGQLYIMDQQIGDADLVPKLQAASQNDAEQRIYLRASKVVPYGRVAQIMAAVTSAGFRKVALVTEPINQ
jgi:biopolymer transport protein TolR